MASALFHTYSLVWIVLFCSRGHAFKPGTVAFVRHACQYGNHFFPRQYISENECKRATCHISDRSLMVEECATTTLDNRSCSVKPGFKQLTFPFCCQAVSCRGKRTIIHGIITYYTTKGAKVFSENAFYVEPTEVWSAPMKYILGACEHGKCRYKKQRIFYVTKLTTPCVSATTYDGKDYIGVQECPLLTESNRNCVKLNDGDPKNRYPFCCPEYMCPPGGREQRNTTFVVTTEMHKGMCKYGQNAFKDTFKTVEPCRAAVCHIQRRQVTVTTCLDEEDLRWTGCKEVSPLKRRYGNYPLCCPDYICPDMAVYRLLEPETHKPQVLKDVCKFRDRYFRKKLYTEDTCELWTCDIKNGKVKVYRCDTSKQDTKPGCTLEVKNPKKRYPDCCERKVCRHYFSTHFPGSYIAPSPL